MFLLCADGLGFFTKSVFQINFSEMIISPLPAIRQRCPAFFPNNSRTKLLNLVWVVADGINKCGYFVKNDNQCGYHFLTIRSTRSNEKIVEVYLKRE